MAVYEGKLTFTNDFATIKNKIDSIGGTKYLLLNNKPCGYVYLPRNGEQQLHLAISSTISFELKEYAVDNNPSKGGLLIDSCRWDASEHYVPMKWLGWLNGMLFDYATNSSSDDEIFMVDNERVSKPVLTEQTFSDEMTFELSVTKDNLLELVITKTEYGSRHGETVRVHIDKMGAGSLRSYLKRMITRVEHIDALNTAIETKVVSEKISGSIKTSITDMSMVVPPMTYLLAYHGNYYDYTDNIITTIDDNDTEIINLREELVKLRAIKNKCRLTAESWEDEDCDTTYGESLREYLEVFNQIKGLKQENKALIKNAKSYNITYYYLHNQDFGKLMGTLLSDYFNI